ncbi:hypothetical protein V8F33_010441 [Rhypophila sp. PSN 637]
MASVAPDTSFFTSYATPDSSYLQPEPSATNACDDGSESSDACSSTPETPSPSPSPSASPSPTPSRSSTTHSENDASSSSDTYIRTQAGVWTGIGVIILILAAISGWFFYRRGKKKGANPQQAESDQEQGSTDTSNTPPGDLLTGAKPELPSDSTDPVRVTAELQADLEEPLLKNGDPNAAANATVVVGELDGTPGTSIHPVELPGSPPPLRVVPVGEGQTRTMAGKSGSPTEDSRNLTADNTTGEGISGVDRKQVGQADRDSESMQTITRTTTPGFGVMKLNPRARLRHVIHMQDMRRYRPIRQS